MTRLFISSAAVWLLRISLFEYSPLGKHAGISRYSAGKKDLLSPQGVFMTLVKNLKLKTILVASNNSKGLTFSLWFLTSATHIFEVTTKRLTFKKAN